MSDNKIYMKEKENPPRKKEAFSTLTITAYPSNEGIDSPNAKTASLKIPKPLVRKIEGPFDKEGNLVDTMVVGETYIFKATEFQRSLFSPINHIHWAEQFDDGEITDLEYRKGVNPHLDNNGYVCYKYKCRKYAETRIYAYISNPIKSVSILVLLIIPRIIITNEVTGYTIQELKGTGVSKLDPNTPAVVVPTYKANVVLHKGENNDELKFSFDVTRDAWYSLGINERKRHVLLNRAFVPENENQNLYGAEWIPSYPNPISTSYLPSGLDAFVFTRFGERTLPAKPLKTQTRLDGTPITEARKTPSRVTDVMIHVGGTYRANGYQTLGGSYGCFGFIQKEDIYSTPEKAKKASADDNYDDNSTNADWKNVADKILNLIGDNKKLQILLQSRNEDENYFPPVVFIE